MCFRFSFLCLLSTILLISWRPLRAQELILYYDFEGDTTVVEDVSGYRDDSGALAPANGTFIDYDGTPNNTSIVADTIDSARRGDVLKAGDTGFGAQAPHARKMDFRNSYTIQAWVRTADSLAFWQLAAGFGWEANTLKSGPRIFMPHWGLGAVGGGKMTNELLWGFGLDTGFEAVQFVSPTGFVDGTQWHHVLLTWNAATQELWGYYDGFDGGDPQDPGLSPVQTDGDFLLAQPNTPFYIADPKDGQGGPALDFYNSSNPHPDFWVDDVAFWQGYAPPSVVAGLFDGTITVPNAAAMMELPTASADFDDDGDSDGSDFLFLQRQIGLGIDDLTPFAVTVADGDGNGDLKVDSLDVKIFENQYGTITPPDPLTTVPEPCSLVLALSALAAGFVRIRVWRVESGRSTL